jgi:predicted signal transduction protein with EAL and GGDEF domain
MVVLPGHDPTAAASALGERLIAAFKTNFDINGHQIQVGLSTGVAIFPADGTDAKNLIANADAALYQAKSEVRGSVRFFEEKLGSRLRELQSDLQKAMDHGDLSLHYQPQKRSNSAKSSDSRRSRVGIARPAGVCRRIRSS